MARDAGRFSSARCAATGPCWSRSGLEPAVLDRRRPPAAARAAAPAQCAPRRGFAGPRRPAGRLAGLSEAEQERLLVTLVCGHAATALGHTSVGGGQPTGPSRELGFDSLTAVELRNRLNGGAACDCRPRCSSTTPTPLAAGRHLLGELGRLTRRRRDRDRAVTASDDDPLAIVGMACRFPGEVDSPEALWRVVAEERDAVGGFPDDRGWDVEGSTTRTRTYPGRATRGTAHSSTTRPTSTRSCSGSRRARRWRWTRSSGCCWRSAWEVFERAGIDPVALRGEQVGVFAGAMQHDYVSWLCTVPTGSRAT